MGRKAAVFALMIVGIAAATRPATAACSMAKFGELPVTMTGLTPLVSVKIEGADVKLIADSGSFFNMLTPQAAKRIGLHVHSAPYGLVVLGATGAADVEEATAKDFALLGITLHHADFLVGAPQFGDLTDGLLGENMLGYTDTEFDFSDGAIRLLQVKDCDKASLAYWSKTQYSVMAIRELTLHSDSIRGVVKVNGANVRALFDTGAPRTILDLKAARAAGVKLDGPGVKPGGMSGGIGRKVIETWIAPVDSFAIGDNEQVENTKLRVGDIELQDADMLVGADFFLSHRILVSKSQSKLYLSYVGGPVFNLDNPDAAPASQPQVAVAAGDQPTDAGGYARRGDAFAARNQYAAAIADFSRAVQLEPGEPQHLIDRGGAYLRSGQPDLALADFTAALKLKPDDVKALMARARLLQSRGDDAAASADLDAATRLDPTERRSVVEIYISAKRYPEAVAEFDAWISTGPKDAELATALDGRCWTRGVWGRDLDKAEADCDAALKLAPGDASVLESRGLVRLRAGEFDKAIADDNAALRESPQYVWSRYCRGIAELSKGLKTQGEADIAAASKSDPDLADRAKAFGLTP